MAFVDSYIATEGASARLMEVEILELFAGGSKAGKIGESRQLPPLYILCCKALDLLKYTIETW